MLIAIGDVVRHRQDRTLGTVAGVSDEGDGNLVAVKLSGGALRFVRPYDLFVVAHAKRHPTAGQSAAAMITLAVALLVAFIGCRSAQVLGADWVLMFLSGLGGYSAVMSAYHWWYRLTGPRRFRV
ncbi:hypothetical protein [Streptomyces sp. cg36]|uniref:hypothetical protein n=1 Tax=Streptomyces sp. cg36 TaxID=3238798 RepID=UPI0034E30215